MVGFKLRSFLGIIFKNKINADKGYLGYFLSIKEFLFIINIKFVKLSFLF